jgi:hypothetical protein
MIPVFLATIQKGKLVFNNPDGFEKYLWKLNDKSVDVVVRLPRKDRSYKQNRFLWGICYELISESTGYTREEVHDAMRLLFLKDEDRAILTLKSTTSLTTVEMNEYWAKIQQFAAEKLNLIIPDPKEVEA